MAFTELPDVIGYTLGEAKEMIRSIGIVLQSVSVLASPREKAVEYNDLYKVIRIKPIDDAKVEVLVCKPDMTKTPLF